MGLSMMGWCRQMQEKSHHLPLVDKFQQQLQDNNDGSDNSAGGSDGSLEGSPAAVTGSVFGAVTLITGTSVGAGILALPATTAPAGFVPSAVVMGLSWGFLLLEALLLAEVNVALMMRQRQTGEKLHSEVLSLRTMAEQTLGPLGGAFTTVTYLMLSYTLLVAYIAKSGEMLSLMFNVPISFGAAVFTFAFGGIICFGGNHTVDDINQALTTLLVGFFLLIVAGGMSAADWSGLEHMDWAMAPQTIPIMILALVYHDLTPVLCAHLGGDKDRIRKSIVLGSMVPLVMFLLWDAVALCLMPVSGSQDSVDVLVRCSLLLQPSCCNCFG
jgi:tyrosine-specific transport protein